jgi:pimeloyl-ACP methyl ester carboxylesterase
VPAAIGFTQYGGGPTPVLVLHDWFCDHTSWDGALPYLTAERFSYAFADLRDMERPRKSTATALWKKLLAMRSLLRIDWVGNVFR